MADNPNDNIPERHNLPPLIVLRGNSQSQLQDDLNKAFFSGYEPEPGLMCTKGNEIWVICVLQDGDDLPDGDYDRSDPPAEPAEPPPPPAQSPNPPLPQQQTGSQQQPQPETNVNAAAAGRRRG